MSGVVLTSLLVFVTMALGQRGLAAEVLIGAASSLTDVMKAYDQAFAKAYPGLAKHMRYNFAGSNVLLAQIQRGAPMGILLTADSQHMDLADQSGKLVPRTRVRFAGNRLVLAGSGVVIKDKVGLGEYLVKISNLGVCQEQVPVGRYTFEFLKRSGLLPGLRGKLVYGDNARHLVAMAQRRAVDAAFVYSSDLTAGMTKLWTVTDSETLPIVYEAAAVKPLGPGVQEWLNFLKTPAAEQVFRDHGFLPPPKP